ncbi:hypothetical protein CPG37_07140 [Malaciobacter canalis]|uniref:DUF4376 domain-containing protein n=1 Tax=Malaciobacter canalis TaxID=1912871 RepID=A0ABX4LPE8_9BACT|nr:hypothetical protein [Malaciobacter canalis]PHO09784.1 hypothetical protein CPG37_07140 [Malaciobacter canalis]QEE33402.1 hypothetical protein ACAN_1938 [Malaciobacter canalis]
MKYVHIDKNGKILGLYDKEIHCFIPRQLDEKGKLIKESYYDLSKVPTPKIEVKEKEYEEIIKHNLNAYDTASKKFIKNDFRTQEEIDKERQIQAKIQKEEELKSLTIDINTVLYDANQEALGNFATVISIANATFNKAISIGIDGTVMSLEDAYNYVYKEQTVNWKGADNKWHTVQIESIVQTAQDAMTKKAEILAKY